MSEKRIKWGDNPSKRQIMIYDYIVGYMTENQYSPTVREICQAVGLKSTSGVWYHLEALKRLGLIDYKSSQPRTIKLHGYKLIKE